MQRHYTTEQTHITQHNQEFVCNSSKVPPPPPPRPKMNFSLIWIHLSSLSDAFLTVQPYWAPQGLEDLGGPEDGVV